MVFSSIDPKSLYRFIKEMKGIFKKAENDQWVEPSSAFEIDLLKFLSSNG